MADSSVSQVEKLDEQPFVAEITLIEQSISYCKSLVATKEKEEKEEKKEVVHNNPEGTEVLVRKEAQSSMQYSFREFPTYEELPPS